MLRFFPMFDFPNNDARNIIVSDIDLHYGDITYNLCRYIIKNDI